MIGGRGNLLSVFVRHPTAANLLMVLMIVAGVISLGRLNTQFFPDFGIDVISVSVVWSGASADDVEANILAALEPEIRPLDEVDKVTGIAREGVGEIRIEYQSNANMQAALSAVENAIAQVTTLPEDSEQPVIRRLVLYETISKLLISGPYPEASLKSIAKRIREDLLARGVDQVTLFGARDEELWVEVEPETLLRLDLTLSDIAERIRAASQDIPSGDTRGGSDRQIRSVGQKRSAPELGTVEVRAFGSGERIMLRDIAAVSEAFEDDVPVGLLNGAPAIEIHIQRAQGADALAAAEVIDGYLRELGGTLPPNLVVKRYDIAAKLIIDRINLLLRNGLGGLILVVGVLFLFLNARVAFWIAAGIPIAVMATLGVMLLSGQSINMVSLFALIMMIGIIVDDAIVVGEHAMSRRAAGLPPLQAAEAGARRMIAPVFAASLTTIAAFLPVMLISGTIGDIIIAIPFVVVAVLVASLIECFLVLPGHMRGALAGELDNVSRFRRRFNAGFELFRDGPFRRFVKTAVSWRYTTIAVVVASLIVTVGLMIGGRVQFVFFPSAESDIVFANFAFAPGTPQARTEAMIAELERAVAAADAELTGGDSVISTTFGIVGRASGDANLRGYNTGDHVGGLMVEMIPSERRAVRTADLIEAWRGHVQTPPGLESLSLNERAGGPPGRDLDLRLSGGNAADLKAAALAVRDLFASYDGVSDVGDDLPWGKQELILELTARGQALGFTTEQVGAQVRGAFDGVVADRFARGDEEVTVRVQFPRGTITMSSLRNLRLRAPGGQEVALSDIVTMREDRGFAVIRRQDGMREVSITAEVDESIANPTELTLKLAATGVPGITGRFGVDNRFAGKFEEQAETLADMGLGALIGLSAIYIILAWVFASYSRPLVVMSIIPFAIVGAVVGHWLTGFDVTILSLVGLLGLSGVVVNDSIILVSTIDEHLAANQDTETAILDGACARLRAVILTSLTTIGGLLPLMFETSLQAQFLKPMALTLVFGLLATTLLVLVVIPALIAIQHDLGHRTRGLGRIVGLVAPKARQHQHEHGKQLEAAE